MLKIDGFSEQSRSNVSESESPPMEIAEPVDAVPAGIPQAIAPDDLDVPAFLRRRSRNASPN